MSKAASVLVGDVGGTHARFAVVETAGKRWKIVKRHDLEAKAFKTFDAAVKSYLDRLGKSAPQTAGIAVAGPVTAGAMKFTNRNWQASEDGLRKLGIKRPLLINDFGALAFGVLELEPRELHTIGPKLPGLEGEPITILGAGTGLGVSCLVRFRGRAIPLSTEGGHIGFAPSDPAEVEVLRVLARKERVSAERILSGPGLENLYLALEQIAGRKSPKLAAADIVAHADKGDKACEAALDMFCAVFGTVAGDFALAHGARGGVLLAGGIAQKIVKRLEKSRFRERFEDKGRLSAYVKAIPTRLIVTEDVAFLGAARASLEFANSTSP